MKKGLFLVVLCLLLAGCASGKGDVKEQGAEKNHVEENAEKSGESAADENTDSGSNLDSTETEEAQKKRDDERNAKPRKLQFPDKDTVLSVREKALQGMEEEDIERLKIIIKTANQSLEFLYIFQNLENNFSDPDSYYWRYLEQTGEFVRGYLYFEGMKEQGEALGLSKEEIEQQFGEPVYANNDYDAERIIQLLDELQGTVHDETFKQNFINMAEYVQKAKDTHDVKYILNIYYLLHDMDYYLLRYGPEDVGPYVDDRSTIETYYGVLEDYKGTEY